MVCDSSERNSSGSVGEHLLKGVQHDGRRGRATGRCAEKGGDAAVFGHHHARAELQVSAPGFVTIDDLHPLAGLDERPLVRYRIREIGTERLYPVFLRLEHFADQILHQTELIQPDMHHRADIGLSLIHI